MLSGLSIFYLTLFLFVWKLPISLEKAIEEPMLKQELKEAIYGGLCSMKVSTGQLNKVIEMANE